MKIILEEQGLRDGIQNLDKVIPTSKKIEIINQLLDAGLSRLQVASFVHPKLVPQMADAEALIEALPITEGVELSGLVLNVKGVERAVATGIKKVACSISTSNTHSEKNTRMTLAEAQQQSQDMIRLAKRHGLKVRAGLQCVFGCRYEGRIQEDHILRMVDSYLQHDIDELSIADSTGMGHPQQVNKLMQKIVKKANGLPIVLHLHNTESKGLANVCAAIDAGVHIFDTAFGGLGGCPFIESASGNIATEDTAHMLHQMGYETDVDIYKVAAIAQDMSTFLGYELQGKMYKLLHNSDVKIV